MDKATVSISNTVAMDFGRTLFGPIGGTIFACMVAFSCFGALNGESFSLIAKSVSHTQKALFSLPRV